MRPAFARKMVQMSCSVKNQIPARAVFKDQSSFPLHFLGAVHTSSDYPVDIPNLLEWLKVTTFCDLPQLSQSCVAVALQSSDKMYSQRCGSPIILQSRFKTRISLSGLGNLETLKVSVFTLSRTILIFRQADSSSGAAQERSREALRSLENSGA